MFIIIKQKDMNSILVTKFLKKMLDKGFRNG